MRIQYALDVLSRDEAMAMASVAVEQGVFCLEAGHVLVKVCGVMILEDLRRRFGAVELVADMKTMDMAADEVRIAAEAGADLVIVCAAASNGALSAALEQAERSHIAVLVSLMGVANRIQRTKELLALGVKRVIAHRGIDDNFAWADAQPAADLRALLELDGISLAVAGGVTAESVDAFVGRGFERVIVGRGISAAKDPSAAARAFVEAAVRDSVARREAARRRSPLAQTSAPNASSR